MAWCHQASSHYLRQCWPRSMPSLFENELHNSILTAHLCIQPFQYLSKNLHYVGRGMHGGLEEFCICPSPSCGQIMKCILPYGCHLSVITYDGMENWHMVNTEISYCATLLQDIDISYFRISCPILTENKMVDQSGMNISQMIVLKTYFCKKMILFLLKCHHQSLFQTGRNDSKSVFGLGLALDRW